MINIHSKLIREELAQMGVDAFAVLICITSHINKQKTAWPGIERLRKMTGLSKERTYKAIGKLIELNHIQRKQVNQNGNFGHTVYRLTTKYLSIFMGVSDCEMYDENIEPFAAFPEHGNTEHAKPEHGNTEHLSIEQPLSIEQLEVLEKGKSAPAQFHVQVHSLETIPTESIDSAGAAFDWMQVAKDMEAHAKGEGKAQWEFMCKAQGYTGEILPIVSNWASKAQRYQLMKWKDEFRKLQTWLKTESRADYKAAQKPTYNNQPAPTVAPAMRLSNPENAPR